MDVEETVARRLAERVGLPCYVETPPKPPAEYLTVEQTGGVGSMFDEVSLDVDCWADKRKRAKAIADLVALQVADLDVIPNIFHPQVENTYRMNDPDTGKRRYVVQVSFFVCE